MEPTAFEPYRIRLEEERARLTKELKSFAAPDPKMPGDWDAKFPLAESDTSSSHSSQDERAEAREEFEAAVAQEQSLESRLADVERALGRIRSGDFGRCRTCGRDIPAERLSANPAAEYDMEHQPRGE